VHDSDSTAGPSPSPLVAIPMLWIRPQATVRRLIDHGDGGWWPWLLVAEVLAGPLAWAIFRVPDFGGIRPEITVHGFTAFTGFMGLALFSLMAGVLLLRELTDRSVPVRDVLLALAWGLVPLLLAAPLMFVFVFSHEGGLSFTSGMLFLGGTPGGVFLALSASWITLFAVAEAGRWTRKPLSTLALLGWVGLHAYTVAFEWFRLYVYSGGGGGFD
jgi:hypothetical protein